MLGEMWGECAMTVKCIWWLKVQTPGQLEREGENGRWAGELEDLLHKPQLAQVAPLCKFEKDTPSQRH